MENSDELLNVFSDRKFSLPDINLIVNGFLGENKSISPSKCMQATIVSAINACIHEKSTKEHIDSVKRYLSKYAQYDKCQESDDDCRFTFYEVMTIACLLVIRYNFANADPFNHLDINNYSNELSRALNEKDRSIYFFFVASLDHKSKGFEAIRTSRFFTDYDDLYHEFQIATDARMHFYAVQLHPFISSAWITLSEKYHFPTCCALGFILGRVPPPLPKNFNLSVPEIELINVIRDTQRHVKQISVKVSNANIKQFEYNLAFASEKAALTAINNAQKPKESLAQRNTTCYFKKVFDVTGPQPQVTVTVVTRY